MSDKTKTIVITGASSGIGKATARFFHEKSWNVVAAMRNPSAEKELLESGRLKLVPLDVQDPTSVRDAVATSLKTFETTQDTARSARLKRPRELRYSANMMSTCSG